MKKTLSRSIRFSLCLTLIAGFCATARAQTAFWTNTVAGEWNTADNWNIDLLGINAVPGAGTNVDIGSVSAATVNYDLPMAATSVGVISLQAGSRLDINTNGFNVDGNASPAALINVLGTVNVNANGVLSVTNGGPIAVPNLGLLNVMGNAIIAMGSTNAPLNIANGGRVNITNGTITVSDSGRLAMPVGSAIIMQGGSFIMTNNLAGLSGINFGVAGDNAGAGITNNGGTIILDQRFEFRGRFSRFIMNGGTLGFPSGVGVTNGIVEPNNDVERQFLINGGTADLGDFVVSRTLTGAGAGLVISNGVVNLSSLRVGIGASRAGVFIGGGVVTNTGVFTIGDRTNAAVTGERRVQFQIRGGSVVSTAAEGILLPAQSNIPTNNVQTAAVLGSILDINAGSLMAEKITLVRSTTSSNSHGTLLLSGSGIITLGSGGLEQNVGAGMSNVSYTVTMSGGTIAAKANYSINANMAISGTSPIFQAANAGGTPFNITHSGIISGSGVLNKTGGGILSLQTNNTYSGSTIISAGTLALGANGGIANSAGISLASGASFDVSALSSFALGGGKTLSGSGTVVGNLSAASGSTITPGASAGTLTFTGNLVESGNVTHNIELSAGSSDLIVVGGTLNLSGVNSILVSAISGTIPAGTYPLFQYGTLIGNVSNLSASGAPGFLTNNTAANRIELVTTGVRAPANVTWVGSPGSPDLWNTLVDTNWLNGGLLDYFVSGDSVLFDATGAANPTVQINSPGVLAGAITVDATANYTFTGTGGISGSAGITKTNSGTLFVLTTNAYTGATVIGGGWLEANTIRNNGTPSSIGAAGISPSSLQFSGGALRYTGATSSSDRGATLNADGVVDVSTAASTLTVSGVVTGPGGLRKVGPGGLVLAGNNTYAGTTTLSNGLLQINGATTAALGTNAVNLASGTLFLNVSGQPTYSFALNLLANSAVNVAANNTVFLATEWSGSDVMNVNVSSGGFFTLNSAISTNFTGTFAMGNSAGQFRFNAGGNSSGAQQCSGSSLVAFDTGTNAVVLLNRNGGGDAFGLYFLGALAGGPGTQLRGSENAGSPSTYQIGDRNQSTTFAGSIRNGHAGQSTPQAAAVVNILKVGTGTLTLSGTNSYIGSTIITNGVLALSGIGHINNSANIAVYSNTVLDVSARTDGRITLNNGQTLRGGGTVRGSVTAQSGSSVTVGDADFVPAALTITNALILQAGSSVTMEVDHFQGFGALTNDVIQGLTSVTYGGTLNVAILTIETNSVFKLFAANSYSGAFDAISPATPGMAAKYAWDTSFLAVDGTLRITFLRPKITAISISGSDIIIDGTDAIAGSDYYVLSSTNALLPVSQWTRLSTNSMGFTGFQLTLTGEFDPASPQRFYLLQLVQ